MKLNNIHLKHYQTQKKYKIVFGSSLNKKFNYQNNEKNKTCQKIKIKKKKNHKINLKRLNI